MKKNTIIGIIIFIIGIAIAISTWIRVENEYAETDKEDTTNEETDARE